MPWAEGGSGCTASSDSSLLQSHQALERPALQLEPRRAFAHKCARPCENGGTLDEATCECTCRGDAQHGWKGHFCSETYGTCLPGAGTGNLEAAKKCPLQNRC